MNELNIELENNSAINHNDITFYKWFFKFNKNAPITEFKIDKKSKSRTFTYDPYGVLMPNVKKISSIKKNSKI